MTPATTRRQFLASAALAVGATGSRITSANGSEQIDRFGGIGWPRDQFDRKFGTGTDSDGLVLYTNPYLPESQLTVGFEDGVATFVDVSVPKSFSDEAELNELVANFMQSDSFARGSWLIHSVDGTPRWEFSEFESGSLSRLGSGSPHVMTTKAFNDDGIVRLTLSLAVSGNGAGFASTSESVGVGNSVDEFASVFGEPYEGHGATGYYDSSFAIEPWSKVTVFSRRDERAGAVITEVSAVSHEGASEEDAITFANATLPHDASLQAGYSSYPAPNRNQGWGMSSWMMPDSEAPVLLFILGDGENRGTVLQVASALDESRL